MFYGLFKNPRHPFATFQKKTRQRKNNINVNFSLAAGGVFYWGFGKSI